MPLFILAQNQTTRSTYTSTMSTMTLLPVCQPSYQGTIFATNAKKDMTIKRIISVTRLLRDNMVSYPYGY